MIYRGPGFLEVEWLGSSPTPQPPTPSDSKLDRRHTVGMRDNLLTGGRGMGVGVGLNYTTARKPGPLIHHSILSAAIWQLVGLGRKVWLFETLIFSVPCHWTQGGGSSAPICIPNKTEWSLVHGFRVRKAFTVSTHLPQQEAHQWIFFLPFRHLYHWYQVLSLDIGGYRLFNLQ